MCGPQAAFFAITAAATAYSQYQGQQAANAASRHQAAMLRAQADSQAKQAIHTLKNAEKVGEAVDKTLAEGQRQKTALRIRGYAQMDLLRQDFAARGIYVDSDTAIDEIELGHTLTMAESNVLYDNYERQALGYKMQSEDLFFQSEQQLKSANQTMLNAGFYAAKARTSNYVAIAATLAGGAANVYGASNFTKKTPLSSGPAQFDANAYSSFKGAGWNVQ